MSLLKLAYLFLLLFLKKNYQSWSRIFELFVIKADIKTQSLSLSTSSLILLQSYWMVKVRGKLWRSSSPATLLKQVHPEKFAQFYSQVSFEYLQRKRLPNTSVGSLFQCPQSEEVFLQIQWNSVCVILCLLILILLLGTTLKSLFPSSWHLPFRYLYALIWFSLSLFSRLNRPSFLSFPF